MKFNYKADFNRCKKHQNTRVLYTSETCPLCDINERLIQLNVIADRILELNIKTNSIAKSMERLF